ncbi:DinB family protein [Chitinophaga defluvii]|uniref:DinB family protein n=1 Tax=Chitinophaga defluvii TaxID=3163343 RepID=A0ABV2T9N2_9BACT
MIDAAIQRLEYLCDVIPPLLTAIDESTFSHKPSPAKWSKKEIIGHLIDSATNNHHRFIRAQFEETPTIVYDQNKWNTYGFYQQISGTQIIAFWTLYNKQLAQLMRHIPTESLQRYCRTNDQPLTLAFLINDYVVHLEHHLKQVVDY